MLAGRIEKRYYITYFLGQVTGFLGAHACGDHPRPEAPRNGSGFIPMVESSLKEKSLTPAVEDKGNILVVDDTAENLDLLSGILTQEGFCVRPAKSGRMA